MESVRDKNGCKVSPPKPNPVLIKNEVPEVSPKPHAEVSRFEIRNREFEMPSRYDHSFNFWVEVKIRISFMVRYHGPKKEEIFSVPRS